jgi:hypothetical protein
MEIMCRMMLVSQPQRSRIVLCIKYPLMVAQNSTYCNAGVFQRNFKKLLETAFSPNSHKLSMALH